MTGVGLSKTFVCEDVVEMDALLGASDLGTIAVRVWGASDSTLDLLGEVRPVVTGIERGDGSIERGKTVFA